MLSLFIFFFNDTATTEIYTLSLHDALPILLDRADARTHRALDGLGRVRVCHHRPPEVGRGPHDLVELVLGEVRVHRVIGGREEPAARSDLDHVRTGADHLAHLGPNAVDPVAPTHREPGVPDAPADR